MAFAHLAFWDRRATGLLRRWEQYGVPPDDPDDEILNAALLDEWRAVAPHRAAGLAIGAAHAVDATVSGLSERTIAAVQAAGDLWLLHRGKHRREHLDQIERALRQGR